MPRSSKPNRRQFVLAATTTAAAGLMVPSFVRASALGLAGRPAPSDRIEMGFIGLGGKGQHNLGVFLGMPEIQAISVCDPQHSSAETACNEINKKNGNQDCRLANDLREFFDKSKFDAVAVSTPDHWHALATVMALKKGAHVYCEKPLANSVKEGRAMARASAQTKKIVQCGSQERSNENVRLACEQVRNGKLGKVHTVEINLPTDEDHHRKVIAQTTLADVRPVPEGFDFDAWLGFTPSRPFRPFMPDEPDRGCHFWWRFNLLYGGGEMTDRGAHIIDLAQLGLGRDDSGPVTYSAKGKRSTGGLFDAFFDFSFENTYADGVKLVGSTNGPRGLKFIGDSGWIMVHIHGGKLEASDPKLIDPADARGNKISLGRSPGHHRNFVDCIKSGEQPFANAEIGHRTASVCHLNNIAMRLERTLTWSPKDEKFLNDDEANRLLSPPMRGWMAPAELAEFM